MEDSKAEEPVEAVDDSKKEEAEGTQEPAKEDEEKKEDEVVEATEAELSGAATKIGAVYRGKKAREEVAKVKAAKEAEANA